MRAARVSPLDQDRAGAELGDQAGGEAPVRGVADAHSGEGLGLRDVGRDEIGQRQEAGAQDADGALREEAGARLGHHHGVDDHVARAVALQGGGDRPDARGVDEHADLDGAGLEVGEDGVDLLRQEPRGKGLDRQDSPAVLGRPGRQRGSPVDAVRRERQEVGLDSGAAAGVGGRDRQRRNRTKSARPGRVLHRMEILWPAPYR